MSELGPYEEMMVKRHIEDDSIFSSFIVGQFGEMMFTKINFDEVVAMSDERYCCLPWDSIFEVEWNEDIICRCSIEIRHSQYVGMVAPYIASL